MKRFTRTDLDAMPQRYRAAFVNSLSGFKSASVIGTCDQRQRTNLCIVSSVVHIGSNPPLMAFVMRPPSVPRDTYENIMLTRSFTINHVSTQWVAQAHQTSARYAQGESEFVATGLTPLWVDDFEAPAVAESPLRMGLRLVNDLPIELNGTRLIIGEVVWTDVPLTAITADGYLDIETIGTATISGLDSYHRTERLARYAYAKPDQDLKTL
ncbi:MAG: flavin reductase family protein [Flavobacteriales bacterium]|jgi:flavin reductase (DIM6/NTAB) family NADH-FMN oxidoreductase RutF